MHKESVNCQLQVRDKWKYCISYLFSFLYPAELYIYHYNFICFILPPYPSIPFKQYFIFIDFFFSEESVVLDTSSCSMEEGPIGGCNETVTNGDSDVFSFIYSSCYTPTVSAIGPNTGTGGTTLDITGSGFSGEACAVEVAIGDHLCVVQTATETSLQCEVDGEGEMDVGILQEVSVNIENLGYARVLPSVPLDRSFVLLPRVDTISISEGSLEGGTELVLTGDGFASTPVVLIGVSECVVNDYNYTTIRCTTSPNTEGVYEISVEVGDLGTPSQWSNPSEFSYSSSSTPVVDSFTPDSVSGESTTMTFTGTFVSAIDTADVTITIGDIDCEVTSVSSSEVTCDVGYVPVGTRSIDVHVAEMGTAEFTGTQEVNSDAELFSVSPTSGSTEGGQYVTITGNGFIEEGASVTIDGNPCTIHYINISFISCITPSGTAGTVDLIVTIGDYTYTGTSGQTDTYEYSSAETPSVTTVSPSSGGSGTTVTVTGTGFSDDANDITVTIDEMECESVSPTDTTSFTCTVGSHSAGTYTVAVHIAGKGNAASSATFEYELGVSTVTPNEGTINNFCL